MNLGNCLPKIKSSYYKTKIVKGKIFHYCLCFKQNVMKWKGMFRNMEKIIMLGTGNGGTLNLYNTCFIIQNGKKIF